jgi:NAD(P)-dependent dehydrogenase (short-subunit alcohol dehydrogenase family)
MNNDGAMNQGSADPAQQSIVITGASSGIGEALALEAARRGHPLILLARRQDELKRVASLCLEAGSPRCHTLHLDLGDFGPATPGGRKAAASLSAKAAGSGAPLPPVQVCPSPSYDARYQLPPGAQVYGAGFAAAGIGRDVTTGKAWGCGVG